MTGGQRRIGGFIAALLLVSSSLVAETTSVAPIRLPIEEGTDLVFTRVPFANGSFHTTVTQIATDDLGFLWFGTSDGLKRYDGYRFLDFRPEIGNRNSLSGLVVESLFRDRTGKLWVTSDLTVDRYDPVTETFTHFPSDPTVLKGPIHEVYQDRAGMIWLATPFGLTRIDPVTGAKTRYLGQSKNVLRSTFEQADGAFWVTDKESLQVFDRATGQITQRIPLRDAEAVKSGRSTNLTVRLLEDHAGDLWVASERDGLARVDRRSSRLTYFALSQAGKAAIEPGVRALLEDRQGTLWIGTNRGLFKLDRDRKKFTRYRNDPEDVESLSTDSVLALFEDREGGIWAGTDGGGVARFDSRPSPFRRYRHHATEGPDGLKTEYVSAVYQDRSGNVWLGGKGTLSRIDLETGRLTSYPLGEARGGLSTSEVLSIVEDGAGRLWLAVWGGGLRRFEPRTGNWKIYRHKADDPYSLGQDSVFTLLIDRQGRLWAGTENGLDAFDSKTERFQVYRVPKLDNNRERAIAEDAHGALWLATLFTGIHRFDPATGEFTVYRHSHSAGSLSNDAVTAILVDHSGTIWAGTANGLNALDTVSGKFKAYFERDGLAGNSITGIQEDQRGDLWLTTNNGLTHFDRGANQFESFYPSDGVPNDLTSIWKGRSGELFVGSHTGLIRFLPGSAEKKRYVAPVVLTGLALSDIPAGIGGDSPLQQSISLTKSLTLSHDQPSFSLEFAAPSYANPAQTRYRYRLEGLEPRWHEVDASRRFARYTTLPPGQYSFHVESRTNRGQWGESDAAIRIRILPPWWATWWCRVLCVVALAGMAWLGYRLRLYQLTRRLNLRFEERLAERSRIAQELHDTLLQGFLSASMQVDLAADRLPSDSQVKPLLEVALQRMRQVIDEGRNTVRGLRSSHTMSLDLEQAFARIQEELAPDPAKGKRVRFSVIIEGGQKPLHPLLRDEIYRIGREAVTNAFRHAKASQIDVEVKYSSSAFHLVVRDDGCGMDKNIAKTAPVGHFGLSGMRERAHRIGGVLRIFSGASAGTEVQLSIPARVAFQQQPHAKPGWFRKNGRLQGEPSIQDRSNA